MSESNPSRIRVSLTQFADFATKPPEQQLTVARKVAKQHLDGYEVPQDFYKGFREGVQAMHRENHEIGFLEQLCSAQTQPGRAKHYSLLFEGYRRFLGNTEVEGMVAPEGVWQLGQLTIRVRPEIAIRMNGDTLLLKLWLSNDPSLNRRRSQILNQLIRESIPACEENLVPAVLDVRRSKLFTSDEHSKDHAAILQAQATSFISLYSYARKQLLTRV